MTMRLKPTYQNHLKAWIKGTIILYAVLVGVYLLSLILFAVSIRGEGNLSGMESVSQVFILVAGIVSFKPNLKLALANGISRKTEFTAAILAASTVAAAIMILNLGVNGLFNTIYPYQSEFNLAYGSFNFSNKGIYYLTGFFYDTVVNLSSFIFGYFIGALYYRMSKPLKILVSVGVPVIFLIGLPVSIALFGNNSLIVTLLNAAARFFYSLSLNPYYSIIWTIITSIVIAVFAFLLIRRAPIKEQD